MDQLGRKKEVLELGYRRMMEIREKLVRYWDSRMAHRLREPQGPGDMILAYNKSLEDQWGKLFHSREPQGPGDMILAYNKSLEDQWGKLFHNRWNGPYMVVEQAPVKSYVLEQLYGTRMAKRFYPQGDGSRNTEEEEGAEEYLEVGLGWVIPARVQNMTPGEILPGAQKPGQIFDSCPGRGQGLLEDIGNKKEGYGWSRGMAWKGDRCMGVEGGVGMVIIGTSSGLQEAVVEDLVKKKVKTEGGFCWILLGFEDEGVAVGENGWHHWEEEQKLGGGAHQGQSGWSKTMGATDL
ncbi:hypothetical protein PPACK8108_LOCUS16307 [Phakopsora pachyrhizi]|uniref:Uncharacterized protein n=1 Tax=Phakopsora pachyrhizi TaxID=170000 RepID=A0AAV0B962_PHAPC|nr:hypothetical protein PPACK8108_LOCUS16307 [Phakopsora pachyrhizi]